MLERLNEANDVTIRSVFDKCFESYGRVIEGYDFSEVTDFMAENTSIPDEGNIYVPSVDGMEKLYICKKIKNAFYGGMDIQIGYCNGKNSTYNGFEYHKGSEINIAVTDFMLVLGHVWEIKDNKYKIEDAQVFYVPKGTAIEMYQTTLHLSPCKVDHQGFKDIVILPKNTNLPLKEKIIPRNEEDKLLLLTNKWVISHPDREPLIKQGAYPGLIGENKELFY